MKKENKLFSLKKISLGSEKCSMYSHISGLLRYSRVIREINKYGNKKEEFLDIGCGQGSYSIYCSYLLNLSIAVDLSFNNINYLRNRIKSLRIKNCLPLLADGMKLPFKDEYFYIILISEVLEHIPPVEIQKVFEEINRVLKPNGIVILTVPSIFLDYQIVKENKIKTILHSYFITESIKKRIMEKRTKKRGSFHNFFTKKELKTKFSDNNFQIIKMKYCVKKHIIIPNILLNKITSFNIKEFFEYLPSFGKHIIVIGAKKIDKM